VNARHAMRAAIVIASIASLVPAARTARADDDVRATLAGHRLAALDGSETTLSSYRGEVVVVNFWASWCAPCRKELPEMNGWNEAWASRGGRVVAISVDKDVRKARRFVSDEKLSLTVLHDGPDGLAQAIDIPSLPCTFLLDREGRVVTVVRSSSPEILAALRKEAESLLSRPASSSIQSAGMGDAPAGVNGGGSER
jgi:thiol-disulfide isomerase/thioredoxin